MPLIPPDSYPLVEALAAIRQRIPDDPEHPFDNLAEACHRGLVRAWIVARDGRKVEIPRSLWKAFALQREFAFDLRLGIVRFPGPPRISGPAYVDRAQLDALLAARARKSVTTQAAVTRCRIWFEQQTLQRKEHPRSYYEATAMREFRVSGRQFHGIWDSVAPPSWKRSGKPKRR